MVNGRVKKPSLKDLSITQADVFVNFLDVLAILRAVHLVFNVALFLKFLIDSKHLF